MTQKKTLFLLAMVVILSTWAVPAAADAPDLDDTFALEAFIDGIVAVQLQERHLPGATVAVVKDGEVLLTKGYGYANLEDKTPVDAEKTLFRIGSVSKLFVWTAVMQLAEQGLLDLDADVNTYLDFRIPDRLVQSGQTEAVGPITLNHLMAHTAGFEDVGLGLFVRRADEMQPLGEYLRAYMPARVFPPGDIGAYSNYGTALAAYIVERVAGLPFYQYVEEHILNPLQMQRTTFRQPLPKHLAPDMAQGYNYVDGAFVKGDFEFIQAYAAGSVSSTAADMARFMLAHLQQGEYNGARILQPETVRLMHRQHFRHDPRLLGMAHGFMEARYNGQRILHHGGDTFLFHSALYLVPRQDLGLFVSYSGVKAGEAHEQLFEAFMDRYFPEDAPSVQPPSHQEGLEAYEGQYYLSRSNFTSLEKLLRLFQSTTVQVNDEGYVLINYGGEAVQYVEVEPGLLQERDGQALLAARKEGDKVTHLMPSVPFVFIRTPWYGTPQFSAALVGISLLVLLGTLLLWLIRLVRNRPGLRLGTPILARLVIVLFTGAFLTLLTFFVRVFSDVDPAYGVPRAFLGDIPALGLSLPAVLAVLAFAAVVLAVAAWRRRYWNAFDRIHYTIVAALTVGVVWVLSFWQLL